MLNMGHVLEVEHEGQTFEGRIIAVEGPSEAPIGVVFKDAGGVDRITWLNPAAVPQEGFVAVYYAHDRGISTKRARTLRELRQYASDDMIEVRKYSYDGITWASRAIWKFGDPLPGG